MIVKDCRGWPFNSTCANLQGFKVFEDSVAKDLYKEMQENHANRSRQKGHKTETKYRRTSIGTVIILHETVNRKCFKLGNKGMIMAAVAYNLKKFVHGIPTNLRKRIKKVQGNGSDGFKDTLLAWIVNIEAFGLANLRISC